MSDSATSNSQGHSVWPKPSTVETSASFITIRTAQVEDLTTVATLLNNSFYPDEGWWHWVSPVLQLGIYQDLRSRLVANSPYQTCLIAIKRQADTLKPISKEVAGTVEVAVRPLSIWQPYSGKAPYISNLAVQKHQRRQGIAQRLLLACERTVWEWGFPDIYLHVLDNNQPARQLYAKAGYQVLEADPTWFSYLGRQRRLLLHKRLQF